ncbi:DUF3305 domain-containing protein [Roseomonas sp. BN140053]|uniref:DUF3305 domain-containing protein n=1 Tax=Roseomonas sp. BN140053 TaxID=3391898 RepID=UPI0039EAADA7
MTQWGDSADTRRIPVWVLAERRPGVTRWAEHVWRAVEVLEDAPDAPAWTLLREEAGRALFLAGRAEVALHPTDTDNLRHNLEAASPSLWVVLRATEAPPGMALHLVTADPGEAHLYADVGNDLLEALPLPPGLAATIAEFVARHYREPTFHKRRRERADPEALAFGRGGRRGTGPSSEGDED